MRSPLAWINDRYHSMRHTDIENVGLKVLALVIATLLFAASRQPTSDVRLERVPIEFRGVAEGLEIAGEIDQTVSVRLRGPRDVVRSLMPNQIAVVADLSGKEPGDRIIQLNPSDVSRPQRLDVLRVDPSTIRLSIEPTARRTVPVRPELTGRAANGYEISEIVINPPMVEVEGPKSQVNAIDAVRTESVALDGRNVTFTTKVGVDHANHSIRIVTPGPVELEVRIGEKKKTADERSTKPKT